MGSGVGGKASPSGARSWRRSISSAAVSEADGGERDRCGSRTKANEDDVHLFKNSCFSLLVLKGIDHCWKYIFFPEGLSKWKTTKIGV